MVDDNESIKATYGTIQGTAEEISYAETLHSGFCGDGYCYWAGTDDKPIEWPVVCTYSTKAYWLRVARSFIKKGVSIKHAIVAYRIISKGERFNNEDKEK